MTLLFLVLPQCVAVSHSFGSVFLVALSLLAAGWRWGGGWGGRGAVIQEREEITYMDYLPFKLEVGIAIF